MMRASFLRRSPFLLLLAAVLLTLGVFLAGDGASPAQASHQIATPTNLTVTAASDTSVTVSWGRGGLPNRQDYRLQWREQGATAVTTQNFLNESGANISKTITGLTSGTTYEFRVRSIGDSGHTDSDWTGWVTASSITMTATFGSDTISDKTYTAGADVNQAYTGDQDQGLPRLPEPTVTFGVDEGKGRYDVVYTLADLPAGLSMTNDRVIRGVPTSAISGAVTVTYTATVTFYTLDEDTSKPNEEFDEAGTDTASLTFTVTVNPPVTFDAEAQKFFAARTVAFTGSGWRNNVLPAAQGGTGTITYSLIENTSGQPLADVSSITFDASARRIGGTAEAGERYAVTYVATDQNGATAQGYIQVRHGVGGL